MNKGEWTNEEKLKTVQINRGRKGKNFMKRIKQWWDTEYLQKKRTMQNLADNTRRFEQESLTL